MLKIAFLRLPSHTLPLISFAAGLAGMLAGGGGGGGGGPFRCQPGAHFHFATFTDLPPAIPGMGGGGGGGGGAGMTSSSPIPYIRFSSGLRNLAAISSSLMRLGIS